MEIFLKQTIKEATGKLNITYFRLFSRMVYMYVKVNGYGYTWARIEHMGDALVGSTIISKKQFDKESRRK